MGHGRAAWGLLLAVCCGCGSGDKWTEARPPVYPAGGRVTYKGLPIYDALVVYVSADGKSSAQGRTDLEGNYQLTTFEDGDGAVEGEHKVVVRKIENVEKPTAYDSPSERSVALIAEDKLPKKYSAPNTTDLKATVSSGGENRAEFTLTN